MGDLDAGDEAVVTGRLDLVQLGEDLAGVGGEGDQHRQVGQRHQGHVGLGLEVEGRGAEAAASPILVSESESDYQTSQAGRPAAIFSRHVLSARRQG